MRTRAGCLEVADGASSPQDDAQGQTLQAASASASARARCTPPRVVAFSRLENAPVPPVKEDDRG